MEAIWTLVSAVDAYLATDTALGTSGGVDATRPRLAGVLYTAAETLRFVAVLAHPVIPDATQKVWEQLGQTGKLVDHRIDQLKWGELKPGTRIGKPEGVFPRADKKEVLEKIEAMENEIRNPGATAPATSHESQVTSHAQAAAAAPAQGEKPLDTSHSPLATASVAKIGIEDFAKIELRVGVVKSAERIQGADKLLKLLVDIGDEVRQVLAGIALGYTPEELVGRKVVIVANLAPRKMRGLE